jgi:hypothetical protein
LCGPNPNAMGEIVRRCDRGRLLWGSDFGFTLTDVVAYRLESLKLLNLTDSDYERIVAENPRRIFGM